MKVGGGVGGGDYKGRFLIFMLFFVGLVVGFFFVWGKVIVNDCKLIKRFSGGEKGGGGS
jgi:hypothetical protein